MHIFSRDYQSFCHNKKNCITTPMLKPLFPGGPGGPGFTSHRLFWAVDSHFSGGKCEGYYKNWSNTTNCCTDTMMQHDASLKYVLLQTKE